MVLQLRAGPSARFFMMTVVRNVVIGTRLLGLVVTTLIVGCGGYEGDVENGDGAIQARTQSYVGTQRPNILLIVVDDLGFTDLGSFGGEIPTPNLDELAKAGTRFTDFQVLPACSPTRATLLTGLEPHAVGFGSLAEELAPNQQGAPAYAGALPVSATTLPRLLQFAGYRTYMAGKWHLGYEGGRGPRFFGFDRSVALLDGGASHFPDMKPAYAKDPNAIAAYTIDDQIINTAPENFSYSSQYYTDELLRFIREGLDERGNDRAAPFFGYLSFTAPHWPLQAPKEAIARFESRYVDGYEKLREQRLEGLKQLGVISDTAVLSPLPPKVRPWSSLTPMEKKREARAMAVYAAMVSEVDHHVGRIINYLKQTGQLDNTVVVFFSDNGPEGHDLDETWPADLFPKIRAVIDERFDHSTDRMGLPGSYTLYGAGWAHAGSPHLRLYKGFPTEGGTRVAAFVTLPGDTPQVQWLDQQVSVRDIMPTLLSLAQAPVPASLQATLTGESLISRILGGSPDTPQPALVIEFLGKQAVKQGRWKLVKLPPPYGNNEFSLYDLHKDLGEREDVSAQFPEKTAELIAAYSHYAASYGVIEPSWVSGY